VLLGVTNRKPTRKTMRIKLGLGICNISMII
jgi:hypothetical protein